MNSTRQVNHLSIVRHAVIPSTNNECDIQQPVKSILALALKRNKSMKVSCYLSLDDDVSISVDMEPLRSFLRRTTGVESFQPSLCMLSSLCVTALKTNQSTRQRYQSTNIWMTSTISIRKLSNNCQSNKWKLLVLVGLRDSWYRTFVVFGNAIHDIGDV